MKNHLIHSLYSLIFESHTNPTKFLLGMTSITWPILEYTMNHHISAFFVAVFIYGVGLMWRIFDYKHRNIPSFLIALLGSVLWTFEAWTNILSYDTGIQSRPMLSPVMFALASLWLLLRCGTGEIIDKNPQLPQYSDLRTPNDTRT